MYKNNTTYYTPLGLNINKLSNAKNFQKKNESLDSYSYLNIVPNTTIHQKKIQLPSNFENSFNFIKIEENKSYSPNKQNKNSNLLNLQQSGNELKLNLHNTRRKNEEFSLLSDYDSSKNLLNKIKEIRGLSETPSLFFGKNKLNIGKEFSLKDKLYQKMNYLSPKYRDIFSNMSSKEACKDATISYRIIHPKLEIQLEFPEEKLNRMALSIKEINEDKLKSLPSIHIKSLQHLVSTMDSKLKLVLKKPLH